MNAIGRPVGTTAEQTRAVVLAAAAEEFGAHGYTQTSIRRIADRAGLTSAAIYYHFPTKLACLEAVQRDALEILRSHWDPIMSRDEHIAERIRLLLKASARINRTHPHMAQIGARAIMEDASGHAEMDSAAADVRAYGEQVFDALVDDAVERGELAEGVSPEATRDMISGLMRGLSYVAALEQPVDRYSAAIEVLGDMLAGDLFTATNDKPRRTARPVHKPVARATTASRP
jgi:AcrR family transcriptional regulator